MTQVDHEVGAAMTIEGIQPHSAVQGMLVLTNPASEQTNGEHVQYVLRLIYLSHVSSALDVCLSNYLIAEHSSFNFCLSTLLLLL